MLKLGLHLLALIGALIGVHANGVYVRTPPPSVYSALSASAKKLFDESMDFNEQYWDETEGYLFQIDSAGIHDTRATAMYATALLARNGKHGSDRARAIRIFEQIVPQQWDQNGTLWYGVYPHTPQDPFPGTSLLGTIPYTSWDPNWRDFVGTAWILALERSGRLIPDSVVSQVEQSLLKAGKGNLLRYQGRGPYANSVTVNSSADNLDAVRAVNCMLVVSSYDIFEAYTNPYLMGVFVMSYIGHRLNDTELIEKSEEDAQTIYDLFTYGDFNTFSEYNSGTYTGVDIWALALWIKYAPKGSNVAKYGPFMLNNTLVDLGTLYHAGLRNLAGPWDRSYGYDMTRYHSVFGQLVTSLAPLHRGAVPSPPAGGLHTNDVACFGPLIPLISSIIADVAPDSVLKNFADFGTTERILKRRLRTNVVDETAIRNVTAWLGETVSIGGQSLDEPSARQSSNVAAIIQWLLPSSLYRNASSTGLPKIGYIALSPPTASIVNATASKNTLSISFPPSTRWTNETAPAVVTFAVGGFDMRASGADMTKGLVGVPGLNISVETSGLGNQATAYSQDGWKAWFSNFYFFNVSYPVTAVWPAVPSITISVS
ncbi:hypothetical protein EW146_g5028 [Bondarzewia mesenterica]|uniref:Uncharacterized protein n=1 Tax=Bondarzewia mesenterica TaxID=1095465 RepID=A0A4S4LTB7_9AGAM|nr:hypothetical protein EW146_g5028 [Bondarzewia mesenterica]